MGQFSKFTVGSENARLMSDRKKRKNRILAANTMDFPASPGIRTAVPTLPGFLPRVTPAWFPPKTDPS